MRTLLRSAIAVMAASAAPTAPAADRETVLVAAASDLRFALEGTAAAFAAQQPRYEIKASYGASGSLLAQIENGAPFDLFLSADIGYARRLVEHGQAEADTLFVYARGHLVLWVPARSPLAALCGPEAVLRDPGARTIAIANPEHAPYGRAAVAALRSLGVDSTERGRLVLGENVAQAAQFVESGAADVGLISLSLALAPPMKERGRFREIPQYAYPPIEQGGVVPTSGRNSAGGRTFAAWLASDAGHAVLERFGFTRVQAEHP